MKKTFLSLLSLLVVLTVRAQDATPSPAALKPLPNSGFVTLEEIVSDFRNAPDAAQQKYGGKQLIVYGRVGQLTNPSDADGVLEVLMQEENNTTPEVRAIFDMDNLPQHSSIEISSDGRQAQLMNRTRRTDEINATRDFLSVDQRVGIKGEYDRFEAGDIVLKDCRRMVKARLKELLKKEKAKDKQAGAAPQQ